MTVRVQNRVRILDRPPIYILDTPGVLCPSHRNVEEVSSLCSNIILIGNETCLM